MKKLIISSLLIVLISVSYETNSSMAAYESDSLINNVNNSEDSKELMLQDMLMLFLLPHINKEISDIYADLINYTPQVYPYFVDVLDIRRVNGFRGFHFRITLDVHPTVGPHISVGEDILTFDISPQYPDNVLLLESKHLKGPQQSDFPPNWLDILKK